MEIIIDTWGDQLGMTSAFGYSGMILMYHLKDIYPELPIYFIDTRYHFKETLNFVNLIRREWKLNIITIGTKKTQEEIEDSISKEAYKHNPDACCFIRKVEPLLEILPTKQAWLSALRQDQAITRKNLSFFEVDARKTLKIYPMSDWNRKECWDFIKTHNVNYHPMHDKNYPSIGCTHCTQPVKRGEHERAGRWNSFPEKLECGIHLHK